MTHSFPTRRSSDLVARQSVLHILGVLRDRHSGAHRAEEARALAAEMTAEQLRRVQARQRPQNDDDGRKADLDRFEAVLQQTGGKADGSQKAGVGRRWGRRPDCRWLGGPPCGARGGRPGWLTAGAVPLKKKK